MTATSDCDIRYTIRVTYTASQKASRESRRIHSDSIHSDSEQPRCRFGEACLYHHPVEHQVKLNRAGYPMRPSGRPCQPFLDTAFCAYGKACMKHHPNLEAIPGATVQPVATAATATAGAVTATGIVSIQSRFTVVNGDTWQADFPQHADDARTCHEFMEAGRCRCALKAILKLPSKPPPKLPTNLSPPAD